MTVIICALLVYTWKKKFKWHVEKRAYISSFVSMLWDENYASYEENSNLGDFYPI